jgi:hypothetical protein
MRKTKRPHRIALSIFVGATAALAVACIDPPGSGSTEQESSATPDADVDNGIGTSPILRDGGILLPTLPTTGGH